MQIESKMKERRRRERAESKRAKRRNRKAARKAKEYGISEQSENPTLDVHSMGNLGQSTL